MTARDVRSTRAPDDAETAHTSADSAGPSARRTATLTRRIRLIVAATISYNVIEAVVALASGAVASSSALVAFGLDSIVEVLSAAAVAWQFAAHDPQSRERTATRLIAVSFFGLAAIVAAGSISALVTATAPAHSLPGIVLAAVSLAIMPLLSWFERRTGRELGSASAVADSKQTLICSYLSAVVLLGLLLNSLLGWWWADPVAALGIAAFAIREGREAWRGDTCCTPVGQLATPAHNHLESGDSCTDCHCD